MRTFESGATRDTDVGKPDYAGFLSPSALQEFGRYMVKHQVQADGSLRASDNWKKGMPLDAYLRSGVRHVVDLWAAHEANGDLDGRLDLACAVLFNVQGYIHETLKEREKTDWRVTWGPWEGASSVGHEVGVAPLNYAAARESLAELMAEAPHAQFLPAGAHSE